MNFMFSVVLKLKEWLGSDLSLCLSYFFLVTRIKCFFDILYYWQNKRQLVYFTLIEIHVNKRSARYILRLTN